jgi:hypothetical protein
MPQAAPAYGQTAANPLPSTGLAAAPDTFTAHDSSPPYPGHVTATPFWENLPDSIPVEIGQTAPRPGRVSLLKQPVSDEERERAASGTAKK